MSELACIIACTVHYVTGQMFQMQRQDLKPCAELTLGTFFPRALLRCRDTSQSQSTVELLVLACCCAALLAGWLPPLVLLVLLVLLHPRSSSLSAGFPVAHDTPLTLRLRDSRRWRWRWCRR